MPQAVPHLTHEDFRALAHRTIDELIDYWKSLESRPVLAQTKPGDVFNALPEHAPAHGLASWDSVFSDLRSFVLPNLTHWQSPNFFAFFPANISGPAIIGDILASGLGVQGMLWATSPAATELETRVLDWLGEMVGLPATFLSAFRGQDSASRTLRGGGVIQSTASDATLSALVAARHRARARTSKNDPHLTLYASTQAHSSITKAAMIAGLAANPEDRTHLRLIDVDDRFALRTDLLEAALRDDLAKGYTPAYICANIGTTSSTAVDSLAAIHDTLARTNARDTAWLHADAAHSGSACICPEFRWMLDGLEHADSFAFNPHKWLLTNFDCNCFWTRDRDSLTGSMSISPEYLRNQATDSGVIDYRDWHVPLGRRFRALKLWLVIRHYGVEGLQAYIREHCRLAALFESSVRADSRFDIVAPTTVNLVCFRLKPLAGETSQATDTRNKALLAKLNATGKLYLIHTTLPLPDATNPAERRSQVVLRMAIGAATTEERHVRAAWEFIRELA